MTKVTSQYLPSLRVRVLSCALALVLLCATSFVSTTDAFADVRKADVIYGETVDARGLAVAQCPSIDANFAMVMDAQGTIYFERNAFTAAQIASITKVMTAVVALDAINEGLVSLDTPVSVSSAAAYVGESSAGLQEGDTMDMATALKALLVPSGNDAAVAIAETVGQALINAGQSTNADPESAFVEAMNSEAQEIGCTDSVYENPHGLDFDEHAGNLHSTASDIAKLIQYAMKNDLFREDVALGDTTITVSRDGQPTDVFLQATDQFINYSDYAIGVKTGFTELAGASFAGATNKDGFELYAIVLDSSSEEQRFVDAATLTDWVYDHLVDYPLAHSDQNVTMNGQSVPLVAEVACESWIDKTVPATLADPAAAVEVFDLNGNVSQVVDFNELTGDIHVGDVVGTITFKQRNQTIAQMDLVACQDQPAPSFFEGIGIWWDRLFRGFSGQPQVAQSVVINETPFLVDRSQTQTTE